MPTMNVCVFGGGQTSASRTIRFGQALGAQADLAQVEIDYSMRAHRVRLIDCLIQSISLIQGAAAGRFKRMLPVASGESSQTTPMCSCSRAGNQTEASDSAWGAGLSSG